ncbi:response regulator transcription factor [Acidovorax sp. FG27]|uniref:response regulator n=1 Tax=Acidovorax sp. FG27 TaxID=3133652 RepID=UPI0030EA1E81
MHKRIILVEDNPAIRASLLSALGDLTLGEVVATAETVDEALKVSSECDWQLMVLDLFLREGNGLSVLEALQQRAAHQQIFMLTNYLSPDVCRRCAALGADAVFDKSTQLDEFFTAIN